MSAFSSFDTFSPSACRATETQRRKGLLLRKSFTFSYLYGWTQKNWSPKINFLSICFAMTTQKVTCHNIFQLIKALVDPRPSLPLKQGLGDLLVGVSPRQRNVWVARAPCCSPQLQLRWVDVNSVSLPWLMALPVQETSQWMSRNQELLRKLSERMPTPRMGCANSSLFLSLIPLIKITFRMTKQRLCQTHWQPWYDQCPELSPPSHDKVQFAKWEGA